MPGGKDVSIVTSNRCARGIRCVNCYQEQVCPGVKMCQLLPGAGVPGVKMCLL